MMRESLEIGASRISSRVGGCSVTIAEEIQCPILILGCRTSANMLSDWEEVVRFATPMTYVFGRGCECQRSS